VTVEIPEPQVEHKVGSIVIHVDGEPVLHALEVDCSPCADNGTFREDCSVCRGTGRAWILTTGAQESVIGFPTQDEALAVGTALAPHAAELRRAHQAHQEAHRSFVAAWREHAKATEAEAEPI